MRQTWCTLRPSIDWPPSVALPSSAVSTPFSTLNSVVLPAPFGPMMPRISPSPTEKLTSLTARKPPKERDSPSTRSNSPPDGLRCMGCDVGRASSTGAGCGKERRNQRSRMVQNKPSGDASMMTMIAAPYTTP